MTAAATTILSQVGPVGPTTQEEKPKKKRRRRKKPVDPTLGLDIQPLTPMPPSALVESSLG